MKWLVLGGAHQGKFAYVNAHCDLQAGDCGGDDLAEALSRPVVNRLHLAVWRLMEQGRNPLEAIPAILDDRADWVVICDEVGLGVVPVDPKTRAWREAVGRICIRLAEQADKVDRITCGIPQRLKG